MLEYFERYSSGWLKKFSLLEKVDGGPLYKLLLKKEKAHNMDINSVQWSSGV